MKSSVIISVAPLGGGSRIPQKLDALRYALSEPLVNLRMADVLGDPLIGRRQCGFDALAKVVGSPTEGSRSHAEFRSQALQVPRLDVLGAILSPELHRELGVRPG